MGEAAEARHHILVRRAVDVIQECRVMRHFGSDGLSWRAVILISLLALAALWWMTTAYLPNLTQV